MPDILIQAKGLKKQYDSRNVVNGVSITVHEKEILAIIGPNGAGKSTTIEMMLGIRKQDEGEVGYWVHDYRKSIGAQLQATPFFPGLTAIENLNLFAAFYKRKLPKQKAVELLTLCGLSEVVKTEASKLSGGQQKRLAIAVALVHDPKVVFLDEPTSALDPKSRREIHQLILDLNRKGTTVVFTSHDMDEVTKLSYRVIMIDQGMVIAEGTVKALCQKHGVQNLEELYLQLTMGEN
ncbi:ABC transporter ATP-binding protein [Sporolactobacillus putidus]|uniref:ABC transporter n=1 Tax=Sporolactobacillus putidus TaxID=492735 RepID=A0A917W2D4_9BACL|nr:ABC transporter ATP-binding protein [Sporolactobacillus putidus]GGL61063.1 ABC transporter [Sporolactobacillus putidus]